MWQEQILSGIGEDPGLKNPDKPQINIKKNVRNHSYHQFYPFVAKIRMNRIRINRGLLYLNTIARNIRTPERFKTSLTKREEQLQNEPLCQRSVASAEAWNASWLITA